MFSEHLNEYILKINCTNRELASASGLSLKSIGSYRNGTRVPKNGSVQVENLSHGIALIAKERGVSLDEDEIKNIFRSDLTKETDIDTNRYLLKLNKLLNTLDISNAAVAKSLRYDSSYISRIRLGKRKPADIYGFTEDIAKLASKRAGDINVLSDLSLLIGADESELQSQYRCSELINEWLISGNISNLPNPFQKFLEHLDEFDLDEYIKVINFEDIKIPTVPFQLPSSKKYFGIKEMMACELDFIKATVTSKSMEDVIIYSEMPMDEMAQDSEFPKKWMFGTAMMLKKGLHMNMIHNVNRPFSEMMLGLESWIPMYMTGQISPYYLKHSDTSVFLNHLKVSGAAALSGEAVSGNFEDGRYYLTKSKEDLMYYRKRAEQLLKKAYPLMEIYNSSRIREFLDFVSESYLFHGTRNKIFASLPVFTMSDELLEKILRRNSVSEENSKKIRNFIEFSRQKTDALLEKNDVNLIIPKFGKKDFEINPPSLSVPELFFEKDLEYNFDEYKEHLLCTEKYASERKRCSVQINEFPSFRNINITIVKNKQVIVSKSKSPTIHFVIKHPRMIEAFEHFSSPIMD